jgi:hypothetical protein
MQMMTKAECRDKAAECEILANKTNDLETKEKWLRLAKSWHGLVDMIDRQAIGGRDA